MTVVTLPVLFKAKHIVDGTPVFISIHTNNHYPYEAVYIRGQARIEQGIEAPEAYRQAAHKYLGEEMAVKALAAAAPMYEQFGVYIIRVEPDDVRFYSYQI